MLTVFCAEKSSRYVERVNDRKILTASTMCYFLFCFVFIKLRQMEECAGSVSTIEAFAAY